MSYTMACTICHASAYWIEDPGGGYWRHAVLPADGHKADTGFFPHEKKDEHGNWVTP